MIASRAKKADAELRTKVLRSMKEALEAKRFDDAKMYGKISADLKERLRSHDYATEDAEIQRLEEADKRRKRLVAVLDGTDSEFQSIFRQPTDPWGEPMPCFPMSERVDKWIWRVVEVGLSTA